MRLKLYIIIFLSISFVTFGQEDARIKKEIASFFAKADKNNLQSVLSFEINNKVGLIDATTKKVLLKPIKNFQVNTLFNPVMTGYYKDYSFEIDSNNFHITVKKDETNTEEHPPIMEVVNSPADPREKMISKEKDFKGFTMDENGNLKTFSEIYEHDFPSYLYPFKYKGKYYAIAGKKADNNKVYYGIIDTEGNTVPHFDFVHEYLYFNEFAKSEEDMWFIVNSYINNSCETLLEKASFMNMEGKEKLKGEIPTSPTADIFGLDANSSGCLKFTAVLDLQKMEWIVKPQSKIKIRWMDYTSKTVLNTHSISDKNKAVIYVKVIDGDSVYYMDLDLRNKYMPIKN